MSGGSVIRRRLRMDSWSRRLALGLLAGAALAQRPTSPGTAPQPGTADDRAALVKQGRYPEAMDAYESVLARSPTDPAARAGEAAAATALALQISREPHPERALDILARAVRYVPDDPELLLNLGVDATLLQQFPLATKTLQAALALRPTDPKTIYAFARLETEEQHLPDAERDFKRYLSLRPDDASAFFGLGHIYAMQQQTDEARRAFEHSLALQPQQTESYFQLGQLDLNLQRDAEAKTEFERALARNPNHAGALTGMGQLALRAKQYAEAEQLLARAEKSDATYPPPHYYRGLALAKLGRTEEAQSELRAGDSRPHATAPESASSP